MIEADDQHCSYEGLAHHLSRSATYIHSINQIHSMAFSTNTKPLFMNENMNDENLTIRELIGLDFLTATTSDILTDRPTLADPEHSLNLMRESMTKCGFEEEEISLVINTYKQDPSLNTMLNDGLFADSIARSHAFPNFR